MASLTLKQGLVALPRPSARCSSQKVHFTARTKAPHGTVQSRLQAVSMRHVCAAASSSSGSMTASAPSAQYTALLDKQVRHKHAYSVK